MKIFNWVHRKFHNKDESSENVRMIKAEHGTGPLLEQFSPGDVLDDWGQGILAIGTLGYDPSSGFNQQVQFHLFENEEDLEDLETEGTKEDGVQVENRTCDDLGGEHNALVLDASKHGFSNKDSCDHDQNATKSEITILAVDDPGNLECVEREVYEKKERITLADLFLADSDEYMHHTNLDIDQGDTLIKPKSIKKAEGTVHSKFKLPFVKKIIPVLKQEHSSSSSHSRGIKKIHKMMNRMLKKKIHPELESKKQIPVKYDGNEVIEMASLLQTQDAIVCP